ncbi:MAG: hypothetical protein NZL95_08340 [Chitinophagales bacterium]|nr:hypothetical protein [Chitinophagales bacterium]MDW8428546.1 hypothetical protein [Chitinophagales bacterium]
MNFKICSCLITIASIFFLPLKPASAQLLEERPRKDLRCTDKEVLANLELMTTTRTYGGYQTMGLWSEALSSEEILRRRYPMEGGILYVAIVTAPKGINALALEIRNSYGEKIEYVTQFNELDNHLINHFFTPPDDDIYVLSVRVINRKSARTCVGLALMKGEDDPTQ